MWDYTTPPNCAGNGTPTKEIDLTYGYLVNNAAFVTQANQLDCNGDLAEQTSYYYDQSAPSATSGLPNHVAAPGARGNLTSVVAGVGSTVTISAQYDDAGSTLSTTDGNRNPTTYSSMCSDAYTEFVYSPVLVAGKDLNSSTVYDCSSGLLTSTADMNGQPTVYSYFTSGDEMGRLKTISYPDGGSTTYSYPSTVEVDTATAQTSSSNVDMKSILDSYGRPYQSVTVAPEGNISSETSYNAQGKPFCTTNQHLQGTNSSTDGPTCSYYDVLGRATETTSSRRRIFDLQLFRPDINSHAMDPHILIMRFITLSALSSRKGGKQIINTMRSTS